MKKAFITGITGQDGSYLAELLLEKKYEVHGLVRRSSSFNRGRIEHLHRDHHLPENKIHLHYGDMTDGLSLNRLVAKIAPDEIYNLAAQSHVAVSFESPEYTSQADAVGTLRLLDTIKSLGMGKSCRFYQASTSEMFGKVVETPQSETTPFYPRSPYGAAKVYACWICVNYREAYGIFACNGILFNHESPIRGETFVTRKITRAVARIQLDLQDVLYLGNLEALRDWGHARDYVEAQWLILQQDEPEDFVIATGRQTSVREFAEKAFARIGVELDWQGSGVDEVGVDSATGIVRVKIDPRYFRLTEVETLVGDGTKAREKLGWVAKTTVDEMIAEMVAEDLEVAKRDQVCRREGFKTFNYFE